MTMRSNWTDRDFWRDNLVGTWRSGPICYLVAGYIGYAMGREPGIGISLLPICLLATVILGLVGGKCAFGMALAFNWVSLATMHYYLWLSGIRTGPENGGMTAGVLVFVLLCDLLIVVIPLCAWTIAAALAKRARDRSERIRGA